MPKENNMDLITNKVNVRINRIMDKVHQRLGGTNPYRQEKVSHKEMMLNFDDMMGREQQLRQQFGDEVFESYKTNVLAKLGGK